MFSFFKKEKKEPENLKDILIHFNNLERVTEELAKEIEKLKEESRLSVQKVGVVRFNPFSAVGGDQSFSIALLNGNDSGVVVTSLYTRTENRVYGKPVQGGISEYALSKEEKEAIEKAKRINS